MEYSKKNHNRNGEDYWFCCPRTGLYKRDTVCHEMCHVMKEIVLTTHSTFLQKQVNLGR